MMKQWLETGATMAMAILLCLMAAVPAAAGSTPTGGARPAVSREAVSSVEGKAITQATPLFFADEVTAAFTATPTTGGLGDALAASRNTFGFTEPIEFNAVLFRSSLFLTFADLQLFVFDQTSGRHIATFTVNGVLAPDDRTDFFIQLDPGALPVGQLKWLMAIFDAFNETFVTPLQALEVR